MTTISALQTSALLILQQQASATDVNDPQKPGAENLLTIANRTADKIGASQQPGSSESKISQAMFSVNNVNVNKLKLDLIDKAGQALGVAQSDYGSREDFVKAMQGAMTKLMTRENGQQAISAIEKDLGLDKLNVSLADVVASAKNPEREDNLTKALEKQAGKSEKTQADAPQPSAIKPDDIGLYALANQ